MYFALLNLNTWLRACS